MSLALTFSCCQRASAGEGCFVPWAFFSEGENWLKGCQCTRKHTSIRTVHTHAHTHSVSALSCTPSKNQVFEMNPDSIKRTYASMLITQVSSSLSKATATRPWSKDAESGLRTWQRKTTRSVKQCVSRVNKSLRRSLRNHVYEETLARLPVKRGKHTRWKPQSGAPNGLLVVAATVERTTGSKLDCELCRHREFISLVGFLEDCSLVAKDIYCKAWKEIHTRRRVPFKSRLSASFSDICGCYVNKHL